MRGVIYTEDSKNEKISGDSKVDATYASIKATCPDSCALKDAGCYAQTSYTGIIVARMNSRARQDSPLQLARSEAKAIDESYRGGAVPAGRPLRLHVSGDSRTIAGSRVINNAVGRWKKRGGGDVWNYTHAFRHVPRETWSNVSTLASIENLSEVAEARAQGYAPAIVVAEHTSDKATKIGNCDTVFIPCPQQTRGIPCVDCRLCMKADWLYETNHGISFAVHGVYKGILKRRLTVIS